MRAKPLIFLGLIALVLFMLQSCGSRKSKCNTRGKIRTEMGWM